MCRNYEAYLLMLLKWYSSKCQAEQAKGLAHGIVRIVL
nr:MAG TPA: hypothetical protein [Caudoviricetes sp.]